MNKSKTAALYLPCTMEYINVNVVCDLFIYLLSMSLCMFRPVSKTGIDFEVGGLVGEGR